MFLKHKTYSLSQGVAVDLLFSKVKKKQKMWPAKADLFTGKLLKVLSVTHQGVCDLRPLKKKFCETGESLILKATTSSGSPKASLSEEVGDILCHISILVTQQWFLNMLVCCKQFLGDHWSLLKFDIQTFLQPWWRATPWLVS